MITFDPKFTLQECSECSGKKVALIRDRESLQINEQKAFKYLLLIFKN